MSSTNGHSPKTAILYARVSTDEQARSGYSLAQQIEALRVYAARKGYEILEEVQDPGQSGASLERPGMDRVRDLVSAGGVSVVLAQDRDRLAREPAYHYLLRREFEEHGTVLRALNDRGDDTPEGELTDGILDQLAKFERAKMAERTRRGKLRRAKEGKVIAGQAAPYGFAYNAGRDNFVVDEERMGVVARIFHEIAGGGSVFGMSQALMRESVPAPAGGENWNHNAIRRIVLSDLYRPHTFEEVREMVAPEVAARLDPDEQYGVWWFNQRRITRRSVARVGPNGREYGEEQRARPKPREEWIAVPVPLGIAVALGITAALVDGAREAMCQGARNYRRTSRAWELSGGVLYCVHCGRMMSYANVKRRNGKRTAYYRCQGHRRNGHKEGCPNARHYRAVDTEKLVWRFIYGLLTNPERLRVGLETMVEQKRRALRSDPGKEVNFWLDKIADVDRQRARAQDLAIEGLLSPEELRAKLDALKEGREAATRELEALQGRRQEVEELERDRDLLLAQYEGMVPEGLDAFGPEDRRWTYKRIRLNVFADSDGSLIATWAFAKDISVISGYTHQDEGNAYGRLGEVLRRLGRRDEAREAYERGIQQAEKYGHSGMAGDLRGDLDQLGG